MTLEDLGNIGEIIGAIAVVISLVYLSTQVRQNTKAVKNATFHDIVREQTVGTDQLNLDADLNRIFYDGLRDFDALPRPDQRRFATFMSNVVRRLENIHYQTEVGTLDPDAWSGIRGHMRYLLSQPGAKTWWSRARNLYNPRLVDFIDSGLP